MKKILISIITGLILFGTVFSNRANAWVNEDINKGLNAKMESLSPEMKDYMNIIMKDFKSLYKDRKAKKEWKSQICFRIDKEGNIYDKNYVIKDGYWINRALEYALGKFTKVQAPPAEYKQEAIFITIKHYDPNTKIYFSNVKED